MPGVPDPFLSVEGPQFVRHVERAIELTRQVEAHNWEFANVPELFARSAACDVAAKEIVVTHDGQIETRYGRLVMKGVGAHFNLMSPESPNTVYLGAHPHVLEHVNRQVGSLGLESHEAFQAMRPRLQVELYNPSVFYARGDVIFWHALNRSGLFPTGFEDISKHLAMGNAIRNLLFTPAIIGSKKDEPIYMVGYATVQFPTQVVEWMPKPLFGGMSPQTLHIETLLTANASKASHPFLPLVAEGKIRLDGHPWYMRRFEGVSPKDATRGPRVPPERPEK